MPPVRLCVALLLSAAALSCAGGGRRLDVNAAPPDQAGMIVVYRPSNLLLLAAASNVVVDGRLVGTVKQGGAWTVLVQPGEHVVGISSSTANQTTPVSLQVDSGEAAYLRVSPGTLRFNLDAVGASEGRAVVTGLALNGKSDLRGDGPSAPVLAAAAAPPTSSPPDPLAAPAELPRMLVMPMQGDALDATTQDTMTQLLVTYLSSSRRFLVLSSKDLERLVDLSAERQQLDCATDACLAEIGNAYGARFVTYSQISKLGELLLINTTLFDVERAAPVGREVAQAQTLAALPGALEAAAQRLVAHSR